MQHPFSFLLRLFVSLMLCFGLLGPSPAHSVTAKKTAPKKVSVEAPEAVQKKLDTFAATTVKSINRCIVPSLTKKEIKKNPDGTFTARYIEIDPKSVSSSYKKPEKAGAVTYIGYLRYAEVEYACTAKNKIEAQKGPFTPKRRELLTELIKYIKGRWTY